MSANAEKSQSRMSIAADAVNVRQKSSFCWGVKSRRRACLPPGPAGSAVAFPGRPSAALVCCPGAAVTLNPPFCWQSRAPALLPFLAPLGRTRLKVFWCLCFFSSVYLSTCEMHSSPSHNPGFFLVESRPLLYNAGPVAGLIFQFLAESIRCRCCTEILEGKGHQILPNVTSRFGFRLSVQQRLRAGLRFVLAALPWAGELTFRLGLTSRWRYPLVPACPVPTLLLLEGGWITEGSLEEAPSLPADFPCGASRCSFSYVEKEMEVVRAMLSKLARDDDNATSENCIGILKGSRCLKGNGFFKWKVILLYVVTAPCFHGCYGPVR